MNLKVSTLLFISVVLLLNEKAIAQGRAGGNTPGNWESDSSGRGSHDRNFDPKIVPFGNEDKNKRPTQVDPDMRTYGEGINTLTVQTINPFKINVTAAFVQVVGTVEIQTRDFTQTEFEFQTDAADDDTNLWDERGRAVLVPGKLICRVTHRKTLTEYEQAGLTLGLMGGVKVGPEVSLVTGGGGGFERLANQFFEATKTCKIGPVPKNTTSEDIAKLCTPCHKKIVPTLKQDVESRMKRLTYLVKTPICKSDNECRVENGNWTVGRCILVRDKNSSLFSECHARSKIGGSCPGKGSPGNFEFKCDSGLSCNKIHEGQGYTFKSLSYDHSKYECRDPQNLNWRSEKEKIKFTRSASVK